MEVTFAGGWPHWLRGKTFWILPAALATHPTPVLVSVSVSAGASVSVSVSVSERECVRECE